MSKQTTFRKDTAELLDRHKRKEFGFLSEDTLNRMGYDAIIVEILNSNKRLKEENTKLKAELENGKTNN